MSALLHSPDLRGMGVGLGACIGQVTAKYATILNKFATHP
jgi:hypothetical protein